MHLIKVFLRLTIYSFILFSFLSCGNDNETPISGNFRFIQLSPDSPSLDVLVDNESLTSDFEFLENTGFTEGPNEGFNLKLTPSDSENQIAANFLNLNLPEIDAPKTYISTGYYRATPPNTLIAIETDQTPADANEVELKWIHASPGLARVTLDIYLVPANNNCTQGLGDEFPIVTDLLYAADDSDYRSIDSGVYDICVVPASNNYDALIINDYEFSSRMRLTLVVFENSSSGPLGLYVLDDVTGKEEILNPQL